MAGATRGAEFPTTPDAADTSFSPNADGYLTKLKPDGSRLIYSTLVGDLGPVGEITDDVAVDSQGNAYIVGNTDSATFPTTANAFDRTFGGPVDGYVVKVNPSGSRFVYSTYLGGTGVDRTTSVAVDGSGQAYTTGATNAEDFPTTSGAYDRSFNGGPFDAFATKVNASGSGLAYSSYLGGGGYEQGYGVVLDGQRRAFVIGETTSRHFPTTANAFDRTYNENQDAFLTAFSPGGSSLDFSTYAGGAERDGGQSIAMRNGRYVIVGVTSGPDFPTTPGAYDRSFNGVQDTFVASGTP